ncbi:hypothetical protein Tco_1038518 [Tanacetum coccineum]
MPQILIPLRPILGVLQIGIKSQVSEDDSDIGSPGVDGPPIMPEDPYAYIPGPEVPPSPDYIPGPEGPPSPDYVPGPEEPEQAPPSPIYTPFVPKPIYPEFLLVDDESPGYIPESDPEEDPEEDDEEDPEEDPADYPADRGDDDDDDDDAEEEEHLAPADPAAAPAPFLSEEVAERLLALPTPPPSPLSPYSSPLPQIPSPPLPIPSQPPNGPTYVEGSLGSRAAGIRQRDALPSPIHETEMPEICLPLRKRPRRTTPGPGYEVGESSAAGAARQVGPTTAEADLYGFADMLDAAPGRQTSKEDRPFHRRTALLMEEEARLSRAAWAQSMDACDQIRSEGISLRTTVMAQQSEITELQAADRRRQTVLVELLKTVNSIQTQMIRLQRQQGPAKDPAEPELPEEASSSS